MKCNIRSRKVALAILSLVFAFNIAHASAQLPATVKAFIPEKMPLQVEFAAVTQVEGKKLLTYRLHNLSNEKLGHIGVNLIIYKADGSARGGSGWIKSDEIAPLSIMDQSAVLDNQVEVGDRVVMSVYQAETSTGQWGINPTLMNELAKAFISGKEIKLPEAKFSPFK